MKQVITICLIMCVLLSCKNTGDNQRLSVNAELLLSNDLIVCPFDTCCYKNTGLLQIVLKNNSGVSTSFWIMKCTWHDSFIFDQNDLNFCRSDCPGNFPIEIELNPNDSVSFYSLIQQKHSYDESRTFRVGFIDFNDDELKNLLRLNKDYQTNKVIYWSNPVALSYKLSGIKLNK